MSTITTRFAVCDRCGESTLVGPDDPDRRPSCPLCPPAVTEQSGRNRARAGQTAAEVTCPCGGATLVRVDALEAWTCRRSHPATPTGRRVTLGTGGALPHDWHDREPFS